MAPLSLRVFTEPQQGASYDDLLAVALEAERLGFDAFFRSDHYLKMGAVSGLPGPTDTWITLAGLARDTSRIRLGTLVTAATFRHPGPLAVSVAQVDQMSGGRVELGIGAGWYEAEHLAGSIPFPALGERFARFEDQLAILKGLWSTPIGETFSYTGTHHCVVESPGLPKPHQEQVPIIIGGGGKRRTPMLAAQYASEFNAPPSTPLPVHLAQRARVEAACETIGRDPSTMLFSGTLPLCLGEDEAAVARRAAAIGRVPAELRESGAAGTVDEVAEKLRSWHEHGVARIYLQVLDLADLDHLRLFADQVVPLLG